MNKLTHLAHLASIYAAYLRRAETVSTLPTRIWLEPTPSCNLTCGHCPHGMETPFEKGLMTWELFTKVIDELTGHVYDVNLFHRGESLIHKRLADMVAYCHDRGMHTRLHTNAGILDEAKAAALIDAGLDYVSFSFDGYTKETYEKNRVGGDFETTVENIRTFLRLKEERVADVVTILQVMEIGEDEAGKQERQDALRARFAGLPLDRFVVRTPHNWAGDFDEFGQGVGDAPSFRFTPCTFLWYSMTIFFDGTVAPCPQDFFGKLVVGDVSRQSVAEVWNGAPMREMRRRMADRNVCGLSPCNGCDILNRKTFMGVPTNYLSTFIKDNLLTK
jgi:radical SAM protein with 4Fe4S-binding SPASM domain